MGARPSLRHLVERERPLVTPLAHDALTARLIARAGFRAMAVGGSALLAARYGLPDIGLAGLGEMAAGIQDIVAATDLPVTVDGDDGYGDVRSVVRMVEVYARLGVAGIVLEDQVRVAKQPGDAGAVGVVPVEEMIQKLGAAVAACRGTDIQVIARCDAAVLHREMVVRGCLSRPVSGLAPALARRATAGPTLEICLALLACHDPVAQVAEDRAPALGRLPIAGRDGQDFLAPVAHGPDHHEDRRLLFLESRLHVHAVSPEVDELAVLEPLLAPRVVLELPAGLQPRNRTRR